MSALRIVGEQPVSLRRRAPQRSTWGHDGSGGRQPSQIRQRQGLHAAALLGGAVGTQYVHNRFRVMSTEQLREVYLRTPDVRAAIDQITRRVSTWNWGVEPTMKAGESGYKEALDIAEESRRFLAAPNDDGETWQVLLTKVVTDVLNFDAGVIELVGNRGKTGALKELVALRGGDIHPVAQNAKGETDPQGRLSGYIQDQYSGGVLSSGVTSARFEKEQIAYIRLFPSTSSFEGSPLIETLITEVTAILSSAQHARLALDADEVPPGLLVLIGVAGAAAQQARDDLKAMKGRDDRLRILTTADPKATGAKWVQLTRDLKDVDFVPVVDQIRRTIWRLFGVMPVEMGVSESLPRAVGEVQLEVGSSHLINPIIEALEAMINARIMPRVAGDPEKASMVRFFFDREAKLSPAEQKAAAERLVLLVKNGMWTRNEARAETGKPGAGASADVLTVTTGTGVIRLDEAIQPSAPDRNPPSVPGEGDGGDDGGSGGDDDKPEGGEEMAPEEGEEGPGEVEAARQPAERAQDLPSEWQPDGLFKDVRTIDLGKLGGLVSSYSRDVKPLYDASLARSLSIIQASYQPGGWTDEEAQVVNGKLSNELDRLAIDWQLATSKHYEDTAKLGRDTATNFTGQMVLENWKELGAAYGQRAMVFLNAEDGLIGTLRTQSRVTTTAYTRAKGQAPADLDLESDAEELTAAFAAAWVANRHRTENWSGRLVELGNETMRSGMQEAGTSIGPGGVVVEEWWAIWESVSDGATCSECEEESAAGFRPLSLFGTMPGGDTSCRARDRCVVVLWRKEEVNDGTAVRLAGPNAGQTGQAP